MLKTSNHHHRHPILARQSHPLAYSHTNHHTFTRLLPTTVGMRRHPLFASAVVRLLWLASMLHARRGDIAGIEKIVHANPIAPFSTPIRDGTARPPPCISPCIVDDAAELELQKMR
jgi:hypothetical protein